MRIVAGCDGGGTSCVVRIVGIENGHVVREARAEAGPANVVSDVDGAVVNIRSATLNALALAGFDDNAKIDQMVAGLAGAATYSNDEDLGARLRAVLPISEVTVMSDVSLLFAAANVHGPAIACIVGTGSIAWARDAAGELHRAGGLGAEAGDEGSAYWIGLRGLELFGIHGIGVSVSEIAALASRVFHVGASNKEAEQIIDDAAHEVARLLRYVGGGTVARRPLKWVCGGGVAVNQPQWLQQIRERCRQLGLELGKPIIVSDPVDGAVAMAKTLLQ